MDLSFDLNLTPRDATIPPLHFVWFVEAGGLGKDTEQVLRPWLDEQIAYGFVSVEPPPRSIAFDNPLKDPAQMAAFLYNYWYLPDELMQYYPQLEEQPALPKTAVL